MNPLQTAIDEERRNMIEAADSTRKTMIDELKGPVGDERAPWPTITMDERMRLAETAMMAFQRKGWPSSGDGAWFDVADAVVASYVASRKPVTEPVKATDEQQTRLVEVLESEVKRLRSKLADSEATNDTLHGHVDALWRAFSELCARAVGAPR